MDSSPDFSGMFHNEPTIAVKAGETLFHKGDEADGFYIVMSGSLRIANGNIVYEDIVPGGLVGEMALIDREPRSATVTALTDSEVVKVDLRRFLFLVQQTPFFSIRVMSVLSQRLRATNQKLHVS
jgi:CRP-like cAMP-binding protein